MASMGTPMGARTRATLRRRLIRATSRRPETHLGGRTGMIGSLLSRMVKVGDLTVRLPGGREHRAGDGSGPPVAIRLTRAGLRRLVANPSLGLGEAYMDEDLVFDQGTI